MRRVAGQPAGKVPLVVSEDEPAHGHASLGKVNLVPKSFTLSKTPKYSHRP